MCFLRSSIDRINYLSFLENGHQLWNVQVHWNLRQTSLCLTCAYLERKLIYYSPADTDYSSHVIIKKYNFEKNENKRGFKPYFKPVVPPKCNTCLRHEDVRTDLHQKYQKSCKFIYFELCKLQKHTF